MGVCDKYQPNAMIFNMGKPTIRWVGNENGLAKEANWNVLKMEGDMMKMDNEAFDNVGMKLEECHGLGNVWIPAECDTTIRKSRFGRKHWFYHTDDEKNLQSLDDLLEIYHKSVGRGANLLLNISPNRQGLLPEVDVQRAREFGKKIKKMYSKPMFLWENQERNEKREIMIDLGKNLLFNTLMLEEAIKSGQRIREYHVEYRENNIWKKLSSGYSIGHKKIDRFKKKKGNAIRLKIPNSLSNPIMKRISLYNN